MHLLAAAFVAVVCLNVVAAVETILRCMDERGTSGSYEQFIQALDGKRVFFLGDSITRYQYIELAFFIAHKQCPDPVRKGYVLSEAWFQDFNDFYGEASAKLEVQSETHRTTELCMATRLQLLPGRVREYRVFHYEDVKGRSFDLVYQQYFTEQYSKLETVISTLRAGQATDLAINFGVWLRNTDSDCGRGGASLMCPDVSWVCKFLKSESHPYRVWWLATTPMAHGDAIVQDIPEDHHMNIARACDLPQKMMLDRTGVLSALEPAEGRRLGLWWGGEGAHFHADANHGFNQLLLHRLPLTASKHAS